MKTVTVVPRPLFEVILTVPLSRFTRSRIPMMPKDPRVLDLCAHYAPAVVGNFEEDFVPVLGEANPTPWSHAHAARRW